MAERAVDPETGQTASFSLFHDIERGRVNRAPSVEHLRAISVALGKPFEAVRQAAIAEYLPERIDTDALLERARQLDAESKRLTEIAQRQAGTGEGPDEATA